MSKPTPQKLHDKKDCPTCGSSLYLFADGTIPYHRYPRAYCAASDSLYEKSERCSYPQLGLGDPVEESSPEPDRRLSDEVTALLSRHNTTMLGLKTLLDEVLKTIAVERTDQRALAAIRDEIHRALGLDKEL